MPDELVTANATIANALQILFMPSPLVGLQSVLLFFQLDVSICDLTAFSPDIDCIVVSCVRRVFIQTNEKRTGGRGVHFSVGKEKGPESFDSSPLYSLVGRE